MSSNASNADGAEQPNAHGITSVPCSVPGKRSYDVRGHNFTVDSRYQILKPIGVGAYGIVISAVDKKDGKMVALKKISGVFEDAIDAKRVLREIRLMQALGHENVRVLQVWGTAYVFNARTPCSDHLPPYLLFRHSIDSAIDRHGGTRIDGGIQ